MREPFIPFIYIPPQLSGANLRIKSLVTSFLYGILAFSPVSTQISVNIPSELPAIKSGSVISLNVLLNNAGPTHQIRLDIVHPQLQILSGLNPNFSLEAGKSLLLLLTFLAPKQIVYGHPWRSYTYRAIHPK